MPITSFSSFGEGIAAGPLEGLSEQAIAAAKKIVFLPKRVNGVNINVAKMIEYSFHIY